MLQAVGSQRGRRDSGAEQQREVLSFQRFKKCCFTSCWPPRCLMGKASHPNCPSPVSDILSLAASKIFFFVYIFSSMVMTCLGTDFVSSSRLELTEPPGLPNL